MQRLERTSRRVRRRGPEHLGARVEAAGHAATRRPHARQGRHARAASWARPSRRCGRRSASSTRPTPRCCRFVKEAAPILEKQIRPFARTAQPFQRNLGAAAQGPRQGGPGPHAARSTDSTASSTSAPTTRAAPRASRGCEQGHLPRDGARAQRGLPVLARLGRPEHRLAVLHGRRDSARSAARTCCNLNCDIFTAGATEVGMPAAEARRACRDLFSGDRGLREPMIKQTPSIGRILAMVVFTLSVFGDPDLPVARLRRPGPAQARRATASPCTCPRRRRSPRRPTSAWRA